MDDRARTLPRLGPPDVPLDEADASRSYWLAYPLAGHPFESEMHPRRP
jgi:hypothetical protein